MDSAAKKIALRGFVDDGTPVGPLGYEDGEPVAWRSIAPRDAYRRMMRLALDKRRGKGDESRAETTGG